MCTALWLYQTNADPAAGVLVAWDKSLTKKPKISAQCSESQCRVAGTQPQRHVQPVRTTGSFYSHEILSLTLPL